MTIAVIVVIIILLGVAALIKLQVSDTPKETAGVKKAELTTKQINKRLAKDPRDPEALYAVATNFFKEENWEKAFQTYAILEELIDGNQRFDAFEVYLNRARCALKLEEQEDEAYRCFTEAWAINRDHFEVNFNLGLLEFNQGNYDKAVVYFLTARTQHEEDFLTLRYLSICFFNMLKYTEALNCIRKTIEVDPTDKESMFILGSCYQELGQYEQALKIFTHLRADPERGPKASLLAGTINQSLFKEEAAVEDFEFGLKHQNIDPETLSELRYKLSIVYIKGNEISKAINLLQALQHDNPNYKDVPTLIQRYEDLNRNKNLQIFILGSHADFIGLCRKMVLGYYARAKVKITNVIAARSEWIDISATVETVKWTDLVVFRFIRTQGAVGELTLRDFHARLKEMKGGKGICITMGTFSDEARRYTETRLIDLLEKDQLLAILVTIDAKISSAAISDAEKSKGTVKEESLDELMTELDEAPEEEITPPEADTEAEREPDPDIPDVG